MRSWSLAAVTLACAVIAWRGGNALTLGLRKRPRRGPRILHATHPLALAQTASVVRGRGLEQRSLGSGFVQQAPITGDFEVMAVFEATVWVGTPPQPATAITDTGSTLLAVPCTTCTSCGTHDGLPPLDMSKSSTAEKCTGSRCSFSQHYAEGDGIDGRYWTDVVSLGAPGDANTGANSYYDRDEVGFRFQFGCTTQESGLFVTQVPDGIIGLGWHTQPQSFVEAAAQKNLLQQKRFSMCLELSGGTLTLGATDDSQHAAAQRRLLPQQQQPGGRGVQGNNGSQAPPSPSPSPSMAPRVPTTWLRNPKPTSSFYVVTVNALRVDGSSVTSGSFNSGTGTIVDSGTSFSYLPQAVYTSLKGHIDTFCSQQGRCGGNHRTHVDQEDGPCFTLNNRADLDDASQWPSVAFDLQAKDGSSTLLHLAPKHVFLHMEWDGSANTVCLGMYSNGGGPALLGANAMMGYDFIFDLENRRVGFAPVSDGGCGFNPAFGTVSDTPSPSPSPSAAVPTASPTPSPSTLSATASPSPSPSTAPATASPTQSPSSAPSSSVEPVLLPSPNASASASPAASPSSSPASGDTSRPNMTFNPDSNGQGGNTSNRGDTATWASSFAAGLALGAMLCGSLAACTVVYAAACARGSVSCCGLSLVVGRPYTPVGGDGEDASDGPTTAAAVASGGGSSRTRSGRRSRRGGSSDALARGNDDLEHPQEEDGVLAGTGGADAAQSIDIGPETPSSDEEDEDEQRGDAVEEEEDSDGAGSIELVDVGGRRLSFEADAQSHEDSDRSAGGDGAAQSAGRGHEPGDADASV